MTRAFPQDSPYWIGMKHGKLPHFSRTNRLINAAGSPASSLNMCKTEARAHHPANRQSAQCSHVKQGPLPANASTYEASHLESRIGSKRVIKWFRIPKHLKQTTNPSFGCVASWQLSAKVSTPRDKSLGPTAVCTTTFICTTSQSSCRVNVSNPRLLSRRQLLRQLVPLDVQAVHASVAALPSTHIRYQAFW